MCELRPGDREADLAAAALAVGGCGGGVKDMARGLLWVDAEGEVMGDEGSTGWASPNRLRTVSLSDGAVCSTSCRSEDRKEGASSMAAAGERAVVGEGPVVTLSLCSWLLDDAPAADVARDGPASV